MNKYLEIILKSHEFQAVEHAFKVAAFMAVSLFVTEIATELQNDPIILNFVGHNSVALVIFGLTNVALAGLIKYLNLKKSQIQSN